MDGWPSRPLLKKVHRNKRCPLYSALPMMSMLGRNAYPLGPRIQYEAEIWGCDHVRMLSEAPFKQEATSTDVFAMSSGSFRVCLCKRNTSIDSVGLVTSISLRIMKGECTDRSYRTRLANEKRSSILDSSPAPHPSDPSIQSYW